MVLGRITLFHVEFDETKPNQLPLVKRLVIEKNADEKLAGGCQILQDAQSGHCHAPCPHGKEEQGNGRYHPRQHQQTILQS